ncbi:2-dehydropantoate 2-reductase [Streptomyces sp. NPDC006552]|uniref:ketopantoate reductase family protein n=1 Tax=Streptomyces sp. NPDC006552 TaxID=3157179 RepID=UPI0033A8BD20
MRILIVGAGATGGAFGTLLQEAGRDVTYLVRPARAAALRRSGLRFASPGNDRTHPVAALVSGEHADPFDLVLITVKATALDAVLTDLRPYVGPKTQVLPILNGMAHLDRLAQAFPGQVLGGLAKIVATLDGDTVRQLTDLTTLTVGTLTQTRGTGVPAPVAEALDVPGVEFTVSDDITGALWEKWVFIAAAGVVTCLFRGPVGRVIDAGGLPRIMDAIAELEAVADKAGHPVSDAAHAQSVALLAQPGSAFTSSLYRDLVAGLPTEAEHILGDLAERARQLGVPTPLLDLTLIQLRTDLPAPGRPSDTARRPH